MSALFPHPDTLTTEQLEAHCAKLRRQGLAGHWAYQPGEHQAFLDHLAARRAAAACAPKAGPLLIAALLTTTAPVLVVIAWLLLR